MQMTIFTGTGAVDAADATVPSLSGFTE